MADADRPGRLRRPPPSFRSVSVQRVEQVTPRMTRVWFAGLDLEAVVSGEPAGSVRLLLPSPVTDELVMPTWNGNEFLLPDGRRPTIRTFTPGLAGESLVLDFVVHERGAASDWVRRAQPGAVAAVSGPGRGYTIDVGAPGYVLAGDETAIPAITQVLEGIPPDTPAHVLIEVAAPDARMPLPRLVSWLDLPPGAPPGDALVTAVRNARIPEGTKVWAAGEAAAVQRIRRHLFEERGVPRTAASVRGYWKHGRHAGADTGDDT